MKKYITIEEEDFNRLLERSKSKKEDLRLKYAFEYSEDLSKRISQLIKTTRIAVSLYYDIISYHRSVKGWRRSFLPTPPQSPNEIERLEIEREARKIAIQLEEEFKVYLQKIMREKKL